MRPLDLKKELKKCYSASATHPELVDVPELTCLMLDGEGKPQKDGFQQAASTLYPLAYTLKYMLKAEDETLNFAVMPMEVVWNLQRAEKRFTWTMLLVQPDFVTPQHFIRAVEQVRQKFNPPLLDRARLERWCEGRVVQMLHRGPYEGMNESFKAMRSFAEDNHLTLRLDTHDIYLNSILRTKPENLRSIIRAVVLNAPVSA